MRKIIDTNALKDPELDHWLASSQRNTAVLIDFLAMEIYKENPIENAVSSLEVLSKFPQQIIVLKSTGHICNLNPRPKGLTDRFIDVNQTRNLPNYFKAVRAAKDGHYKAEAEILELAKDANNHLNEMLRRAEGIKAGIRNIESEYSEPELSIIRKNNSQYTHDMKIKFYNHVFSMMHELYSYSEISQPIPSKERVPYSFIFRYCLCVYLVALNRISTGASESINPKKIRNDMVDMFYAAYATYFDGLISNDSRLNDTYEKAKFFIEDIFLGNKIQAPKPSKKTPKKYSV